MDNPWIDKAYAMINKYAKELSLPTSYNIDNKTVSDAHIFGEQDDESISDYMFFKVTK